MSLDVEQRIRDRAYAIWLEQGCPDGCDGDHWLQAERDIAAQTGTVVDPEPTAKAPRKTVRKAKAAPPVAAPEPAVLPDDASKTRKPRARKTMPA